MAKPDPQTFFTIDSPADPELVEAGRRLFAQEPQFMLSAAALEQVPTGDRVEICFAGRSNVGKSSLINALVGRKGVARASNTPGRTQHLNYFSLEQAEVGALYVVDLPGYGYAKAPPLVVAQWQKLLKAYLAGRASLRRAFVLIDSRHGVKEVDHDIMELLDRAAVPFQAILTKIDKPKAAELEQTMAQVKRDLARHPTAHPEIIATSSEKGIGLELARAAIADLLRP